jgi:tetratricopeptide (TPR) repeat protein
MLGRRVVRNMKKAKPAKSEIKPARKATAAASANGGSAADARATNGKRLSKTVDRLFAQEKWAKARAVLEKELVRDPESHWLRARLSTTYYEERNYDRALEEIELAYHRRPECPLVLWDYAGTLDAVGRTAEAIEIYGSLLGKGVDAVAHDECGEGVPWAIGLLTDCCFRLGVCYENLGNAPAAAKHFTAYLVLRTSNHAVSIYSLQDALTHLDRLPVAGKASLRRFEEMKRELQRTLVLS